MFRWRADRLSPNLPDGPAGTYAIVVFWVASLMALWLFWQGAGLRSMLLPSVCFLVIVSRGRLVIALLAVLFLMMDEVGYFWAPPTEGWAMLTDAWIIIPTMVLIIGSFRYQALAHRILPVHASPVSVLLDADADQASRAKSASTVRDPTTFDLSELWIPVVQAAACLYVSAVVIHWLYEASDSIVVSHVNPQALLMARLVLAGFVSVMLVHGALGYLRLRQMSRTQSEMYVKNEFWQCCRREQRLISRQRLRRNKKISNRTK